MEEQQNVVVEKPTPDMAALDAAAARKPVPIMDKLRESQEKRDADTEEAKARRAARLEAEQIADSESREEEAVEGASVEYRDVASTVEVEESNPFAQKSRSILSEPTPVPFPPGPATVSQAFTHKAAPMPIPLPEPAGSRSRSTARGGNVNKIPTKQQPQAQSPSVRRLGAIGAKLPGAEHIKVRKRDPRTGQMMHIGDYNIRDIPHSMDFESFLAAYVGPTHGGGDYYLTGVDANGRDMDAGIIRLADKPQEEPKGEGMMDILKMMMQREQQANQRMMEMMSGSQRHEDPIDQMRKVAHLKNELAPEMPKDDSPLAAIVQMMGQQNQMFMAAQQQQQQQMMAMMAANKPDNSMLMMLLAKMEEKEKSSSSAMPLPPPPPAPMGGLDLNTLLPTLLTSLPAIVEMLRREDPSVALLKEMVVSKQGDGLSTRDVIELLTSKTGTDDFKAAAENMSMMLNIQSMMQERMGGGGGGFMDSIGSALGALFSNGNFAGSLAENIQASAEQKRRSIPDDEAERARRQIAAERQAIEREKRALLAAREQLKNQALAAPKSVPPEAAEPERAQAEAESVAEPTEEMRQAAERVQERSGQLPEFPPELPERLNSWVEALEIGADSEGNMTVEACDDGQLAEAVVNTFVFLFQVPTWNPLVSRLFRSVQHGHKEESLQMVNAFIEAFVSIGALDPQVAREASRTMDEHFAPIVQTLRGFLGSPAESVTQDVSSVSDVSELYEGVGEMLDEEFDDDEYEDLEDEDADGPQAAE